MDFIPVIPLKEIVVFPNSITPLFIVRKRSLTALEAAIEGDKRVFLTAQFEPENENPGPADLHECGTFADIIQVLRLPDGSAKVLVEGQESGRVVHFDDDGEHLKAVVEETTCRKCPVKRREALKRLLMAQFETYSSLSDKIPEDLAASIRGLDDALQLANAIANYCFFKVEDKQKILEASREEEKLRLLSELLTQENELLELENTIISQVKNKINKSQKEFFLNEQLKAIERELGLASEEDAELEEFEERIKKAKMSKEAEEKAFKELSRLAKMPQMSPEATVSRTYIEWLLDMPWGKRTKDADDLERAQKILDGDHFGLEEVKERIVEHLAVLKLVKEMKGPILCLVGPPGVGKTSLGKSIAAALKRKFVRVSLGGVRDEAEIRGHRRTYIGSLPGKLIQSMKKAGSMNPVFLLDEIDKLASDFRGDPAAALLEALDPEQNKTFNDHYMEIDFDLSQAMFVTTANTVAGIPEPLLDRMELIRLPGYTEDEKRKIARQFLIPRQIKEHGLAKRRLKFDDKAIDLVIQRYTREAGVRTLERAIAKLCRKAACEIAGGGDKLKAIDAAFVRAQLGPEKFKDPELHEPSETGVATGLAWTSAGGEILPVETITMPGKGAFQITGKLGEVMQESAKAALSWIRAHADEYKIPAEFQKKLDLHVHIPEGAIPKDGPSAGVTMITSMVSALTGAPVRRDLAMTGEITLLGKVLKIGGLKEKVIAAHRNRITDIAIPADNEPDLEEIDKAIRADLTFHPVKTVGEVLALALEKTAPKKKAASKSSTGKKSATKKTARHSPARGRQRPAA